MPSGGKFLRAVALEAARGRLEAVLEAVLEAAPRGRRKTWVFPVVPWFKEGFSKETFSIRRIAENPAFYNVP